jgi:hypothetical protein
MQQWHNDLAPALSLDGEWELSLAGKTGPIRVPGCWEAQGFDHRADGLATMQRSIDVPQDWRGSCIQLQFDAVSYYVEVTVNGIPVGTHTGSWTPFAFDVTEAIHPGEVNTINLTIYKPGGRFPLRESLVGFLPDVAMMFGGVWQSARLVAFSGPAFSDIAVQVDSHTRLATIKAVAHRAGGLGATIEIHAPPGSFVQASAQAFGLSDREEQPTTGILGVETQWSPDSPSLYTARISLSDNSQTLAQVSRPFGLRILSHEGAQLVLNGQPICLRGVLNWGWYPDILCPAPNEAKIRDEFRRVRELGFNMVKLCLYVPSDLYFRIADEMGMLLWLELPMWQPEVSEHLRQQAPIEYAGIIAAVQHHPSIVIYSLGCELGGSVDAELLGQLDHIARERVTGALFCDNSGSGEAYGGLAYDFADFNDYHFYCDLHYFDPLVEHFRRDWRPPRPWIFGEFNDADDYRDVNEIADAHNGQLPWWFTERNPIHPMTFPAYAEQRERMDAVRSQIGLDDQALVRLSRQESFVVRKTILEKVRVRSGMGGYVVTGLRDTPLATSAVFDDLGRSKYDPDAFRAFNADTVLLLGWGRSRVWKHGGDRPAPSTPYTLLAGQEAGFSIVLAHAGSPLSSGELKWRIVDEHDMSIAHGTQQVEGPLAGGPPRVIGTAQFRTPITDVALTVRIDVEFSAGRQAYHNTWPLWVFPEVTAWPAGIGLVDPSECLSGLDDLWQHARDHGGGRLTILLTGVLDQDVMRFLDSGGSALLIQQGTSPLPAQACPFWREGIKIIGDHPAMAEFPHGGYVHLQYYGLATDWAIDTNQLATVLPNVTSVRSLLRRLDARQFTVSDYLIDMQVGAGRLIATTLRFQGGLGDQPAGFKFQTAGRWLLYQLLIALRPNEA